MKKFTLLMAAALTFAASASAQYTGHKWTDNWSIGVDGGVGTNLRDWDTPNGALVGIQLTKGITPVVSFEISAQAGINNNANWNGMHSVNILDNVNLLGSAKFNLMNLFCGYKGEPRLFEIQARTGVGYMRYFFPEFVGNPTDSRNDLNRGVAKFGFDFDFNLGAEKAWTVSLRPAVIMKTSRDFWGCDNGNKDRYGHNAQAQITAGVTYHFLTSNGTRHFVTVSPQEVTKLVEKVVEKPVDRVVEKVVEKSVVTNNGSNTVVVEFAQSKYNLTDAAKAKLNEIAKGSVVVLDAYASPEGSKSFNQKLSQNRADAVKKYLQDRGVKVDGANAHGSTGKDSQRIVYVRVK